MRHTLKMQVSTTLNVNQWGLPDLRGQAGTLVEIMKNEPRVFRLDLLLPDDHNYSTEVGEEEHIWDAAFKAGIHLPALWHQGYCLTCAGRILSPLLGYSHK